MSGFGRNHYLDGGYIDDVLDFSFLGAYLYI